MPLILSALLSLFLITPNQAFGQISAELRAGIQTDRSQDPLPDGKKYSLGLGYNYGLWDFLINYSHIGRDDVGNASVGTKLTTKEFLLWIRYHFYKGEHIETYGGIGGGFKLDTANIRLYDSTVTEKSEPQWLAGICGGTNFPIINGVNGEQIVANLEVDLINQPGFDFIEASLLLGLSIRF